MLQWSPVTWIGILVIGLLFAAAPGGTVAQVCLNGGIQLQGYNSSLLGGTCSLLACSTTPCRNNGTCTDLPSISLVNSTTCVSLYNTTTNILLGSAGNYSVLANTAITGGSAVVTGNIGIYPGSSITQFPPATFSGVEDIDNAAAIQAKADLTAAYIQAAALAPTATIASALGSQSLTPGVYTSASGTFGLTGTLTLNGLGNPASVWVFQMATTLTTAAASVVVMTNGGQPGNVYWQVGSSVSLLGAGSTFVGNILALTSITVDTTATVTGRLLARNGAVVFNGAATVAPLAVQNVTNCTTTSSYSVLSPSPFNCSCLPGYTGIYCQAKVNVTSRYIFETRRTFTGNAITAFGLAGVQAADAVCQSEFLAAGLTGNATAWISDGVLPDARSRLYNGGGNTPYTLIDGTLALSNLTTLLTSTTVSPFLTTTYMDAFGDVLAPTANGTGVWSSTLVNGTYDSRPVGAPDLPNSDVYAQLNYYGVSTTCAGSITLTTFYKIGVCVATGPATSTQMVLANTTTVELQTFNTANCTNSTLSNVTYYNQQCTAVGSTGYTLLFPVVNTTFTSLTTFSDTNCSVVSFGPSLIALGVCQSGIGYSIAPATIEICNSCTNGAFIQTGTCVDTGIRSGVCTSNGGSSVRYIFSNQTASPTCGQWGANPTSIASFGRTGFGDTSALPIPCTRQQRLMCIQSPPHCLQPGYVLPYCTPCGPGSFANSTLVSSCTRCPPGSFSNTTALTACFSCNPGTIQPAFGGTSCLLIQSSSVAPSSTAVSSSAPLSSSASASSTVAASSTALVAVISSTAADTVVLQNSSTAGNVTLPTAATTFFAAGGYLGLTFAGVAVGVVVIGGAAALMAACTGTGTGVVGVSSIAIAGSGDGKKPPRRRRRRSSSKPNNDDPDTNTDSPLVVVDDS